MNLQNIRLAKSMTIGQAEVTSLAVGAKVGTWADGPRVTHITTEDGIVTVRVEGGRTYAYGGSWSGELVVAPERKVARK